MNTRSRPPAAPHAESATIGGADQVLSEQAVVGFVQEQLSRLPVDGKSVALVIPDGTRSCPLPLLLRAVHTALHGRVTRLTAVVALGTHAAMDPARLAAHVGAPSGDIAGTYPGLRVVNHEWWQSGTFATIGRISAERISALSEGRIREPVDVRVNRAVVEHDVAIVVGPVFPHEVVGFSGGNKYFFPGISGPEIIDVSHWLGALITSVEIIGTPGLTPVRALIDDAAALIPAQTHALCLVVKSGTHDLHAVSFGRPQAAWAAAAAVSAQAHVRYLDRPVRRVLSLMPERYPDMWTAAKGFYKVEPVVADGGEVVIYGPHITEVAATHPEILEVGYHCRDYFVRQWERFRHIHWGVLAHSTHLYGAGSYDLQRGEQARVRVTLATGIPAEVVRRVNLGHLDPDEVDVESLRAHPDTLVVPDAGEVLFRLRPQ